MIADSINTEVWCLERGNSGRLPTPGPSMWGDFPSSSRIWESTSSTSQENTWISQNYLQALFSYVASLTRSSRTATWAATRWCPGSPPTPCPPTRRATRGKRGPSTLSRTSRPGPMLQPPRSSLTTRSRNQEGGRRIHPHPLSPAGMSSRLTTKSPYI